MEIKDRVMSCITQDEAFYTGDRSVLGSFITANNNKSCLGSFRIPKSFVEVMGTQLSPKVIVKCGNIAWKAKIDADLKIISGLRRFMRYYEIKLWNAVKFDYYGQDLFLVEIFKETTVECNYPKLDPEEFLINEEMENWREDQYVIDRLSIEYQKASALWNFNAFTEFDPYYNIRIRSFDIDKKVENPVMHPDLENLYKNWKDGTNVSISILNRSWDIVVCWKEGKPSFGSGWSDFAHEVHLEDVDTLVLYSLKSSDMNKVKACIFKANHEILDEDQDTEEWNISFFKVLTDSCLEGGVLVLPKLIKEKYRDKLIRTKKIEIYGKSWFISYNYIGGYVTNLKLMMDHFKLRQMETVVLSMDNSNVIYGRIYQVDGREIDYYGRSTRSLNSTKSKCFWDFDDASESEYTNQLGAQDIPMQIMKIGESSNRTIASDVNHHNELGGQDITMQIMEIGERSNRIVPSDVNYPAFIICYKPEQSATGKMIIPETICWTYGDDIPPSVRIQLPHGREFHANFLSEEQSFGKMHRFLVAVRKQFGSFFVFFYKGNGNFLVNVLNEGASEIETTKIARVPKSNQDYLGGIGLKFVTFVIGATYEFGEIVIPDSFSERLGNPLPPTVTFALSNGHIVHGNYIENDKKMVGLVHFMGSNYVDRKDFLLFTYRGEGQFDMVLFDNSKVEKTFAMDWTEIDSGAPDETNIHETNQEDEQNQEIQEEDELSENEMIDMQMEFTVRLTMSNVNQSSHGVYIPRDIVPRNRQWQSGEDVTLRTNIGEWMNRIVFNSNGLPRLSAGWNTFANENELHLDQSLVFTMVEEEGRIVFDVQSL